MISQTWLSLLRVRPWGHPSPSPDVVLMTPRGNKELLCAPQTWFSPAPFSVESCVPFVAFLLSLVLGWVVGGGWEVGIRRLE